MAKRSKANQNDDFARHVVVTKHGTRFAILLWENGILRTGDVADTRNDMLTIVDEWLSHIR